jgi:hypothetical protein
MVHHWRGNGEEPFRQPVTPYPFLQGYYFLSIIIAKADEIRLVNTT